MKMWKSIMACIAMLFSVNALAGATPAPLSKADTNKVISWITTEVAALKTPYCYKLSSGRGAGVPVDSCDSDQDKEGALCYPKCRDGYTSDGAALCYEKCRNGYSNSTVGMCHYTGGGSTYTRSCHYDWRKAKTTCDSCRDGYTSTSSIDRTCWFKGAWDYAKNSYGRGAGSPMKCASGKEYDAGLCYSPCASGSTGIGPVCWQNCPSGTTSCGVGCASSTTLCAANTANMILSPAMLAANMLTAGATSGLAKAIQWLTTPSTLGMYAMFGATEAVVWTDFYLAAEAAFPELTTPAIVNKLKATFGPQGYKYIVYRYVLSLAAVSDETIMGAVKGGGALDPTGVMSIAAAFTQPMCIRGAEFPNVTVLNKF